MRIIIGSLRFVEITQDQPFFGCELILLKNCNQQFAGSLIWQKKKTELNILLSSLIYLTNDHTTPEHSSQNKRE
jgi:hypothetical protein